MGFCMSVFLGLFLSVSTLMCLPIYVFLFHEMGASPATGLEFSGNPRDTSGSIACWSQGPRSLKAPLQWAWLTLEPFHWPVLLQVPPHVHLPLPSAESVLSSRPVWRQGSEGPSHHPEATS